MLLTECDDRDLERPPSYPGIRVTPHGVVSAASEGILPDWAVAGAERRDHMERVARLLESWAEALGLPEEGRTRWRAAGYLHDALRDEKPAALREHVPLDLRHFPDPLLHGPAAAEHLRLAGVLDAELLSAVAFHTVGDRALGALGRALYAADFLEPGRAFLAEWRAGLRARMPEDADGVLYEIVRARIRNLLERGSMLLPQTVAFWNVLVEERP